MSFKQEKHDIVMKHDEEDKKGSDLATALEEDQAGYILTELSKVYIGLRKTLPYNLSANPHLTFHGSRTPHIPSLI